MYLVVLPHTESSLSLTLRSCVIIGCQKIEPSALNNRWALRKKTCISRKFTGERSPVWPHRAQQYGVALALDFEFCHPFELHVLWDPDRLICIVLKNRNRAHESLLEQKIDRLILGICNIC
jgi:hypothetical protein